MAICAACQQLIDAPSRTPPHDALVEESAFGPADAVANVGPVGYIRFFHCEHHLCSARLARHETSRWLLWSEQRGLSGPVAEATSPA